jgi:WD40 repeat protein
MVDFKAKPKLNASGPGLNVPEIMPVAENRDHSNSVDAICGSPALDGQYASGSHDKSIKLWNVHNGQCLATMSGHANGVWCLNYFGDAKKLLSASSDGTSRIWDVNSGKSTASLGHHTGRVYYATPNFDGTLVASAGSDKIINVWDLRNVSKPVISNKDSQEVIMSCAFTNDNKHVVTGTMGGVLNGLNLEN